jgi:PAS domain S-box-containing protein
MAKRVHFGSAPWLWVAVFLVAALALVAGGYWYYRSETERIRRERHHEIAAIGKLKAAQIEQWREEQLSDVRRSTKAVFFQQAVQDWLRDMSNASLQEKIRDRLMLEQKEEGYADVLLVDTEGRILISANPEPHPLSPVAKEAIGRALSTRSSVLSDLYRCPLGMVHVDAIGPILGADGRPDAVLVLRSNAETVLYPLIQSWPIPSESAETLLVRRDGEDVLFLNDLRHRPNSALSLREPLTRQDLPAVQAVLGKEGVFQGRDYRGVDVLADLRRIPQSSWFMVAKVDADEILAEARYRGGIVALFAGLFIVLATSVTTYGYRYRQVHFYRDLYRSEREMRAAQEQFRTILYSIGDAVITTDTEGLVSQMNPVAERLTGWSEDEARGIALEEVFHIVNEETRAAVENPVQRILREGTVVGLANHTVLISKAGAEHPIADSGAPIRGEKGEIMGVVLVFRDQTEERNAQKALMVGEKRYRDLWEKAPVMMISLDAQARINFASDRFCDELGYERSEVLGRRPFEFQTADSAHYAQSVVFPAFLQTGSVKDAPLQFVKKDGQIVDVLLNATAERDAQGTIVRSRSVFTDITDRKRTEEALRESEARYRYLVENIEDLICTHDLQGNLLFVSSGQATTLGSTPAEMVGTNLRSYLAPEVRDQFDAYLDTIKRDGRSSGLMLVQRSSGERRIWEYRNRLQTESGVEPIVLGVARDVTERKRAEAKIRRQSKLLAAINKVLQEALESETDADIARACLQTAEELTGSRVGFIGELNEAGCLDTIAVSDSVWSGCKVADSDAPLLIKHMVVRGIWASVLTTDQSQIVNDPASHPESVGIPDGHPPLVSFMGVPLRRSGKTFGLIALANKDGGYDPSDLGGVEALSSAFAEALDRKRAERSLHESEERYRTLFDQSKDGVYITTRDGKLVDANQAYLDLFGLTKEEARDLNILDIYPEPAAKNRDRFRRDIEKTGSLKDYEITLKRKDGRLIDCLSTSTLKRAPDGTILGYQGTVRDVTEYKQLQNQLIQAQKMEAIGTLAGGIAHDFNNLLQVVLGYSDLILSDEHFPPQYKEDLTKISQAARNGADLVQGLLAFSRKAEAKPRPLNLNRRIEQLQKMLSRTIPKMIEIELVLADDLATINADPTQMEQILMNLAVNARDAMREGGKLSIKTENVTLGEDYRRTHPEAKPGRYVLLSVADTGKGMDKETVEHIFDPFFTTKGPGEGTGLGLAMVYGIVKQHGGHITCYSELSQGTVFKMYFPALVAERELQETKVRAMPRGGSETILLVDDEELVRDLGARILSKAGYNVISASDGKEALELFQANKEGISVVILDLIMPQLGGKQCLDRMLAISPTVKVLIASGHLPSDTTREALASNARGFVDKPYDMRQLLEIVRSVLDDKSFDREE